jgi:hypothetical protein
VLIDRASEGATETGEMRAAIRIVDRVGIAEDLIVVRVVVLEDDFRVNFDFLVVELHVGFFDDRDGFRMQRSLACVDLLNEFLDAVFVEIDLGFEFGGSFVGEDDFESRIEEGEFAQALADAAVLENRGFAKDFRVRLEGDVRTCGASFPDDLQFLGGLTTLKLHVVNLTTAGDLHFEPFGHGIDAFGADAVRAAREFVSALAVFTARM